MHVFSVRGARAGRVEPARDRADRRQLRARGDGGARLRSSSAPRSTRTSVVLYANSFGSFWGMQFAACDPRFTAVAATQASLCEKYIQTDLESPRWKQLMAFLTQAEDEAELDQIMRRHDHERLHGQTINAPLLLTVGEYDPRAPLDEVLPALRPADRARRAVGDGRPAPQLRDRRRTRAPGWAAASHSIVTDWLRDRLAGQAASPTPARSSTCDGKRAPTVRPQPRSAVVRGRSVMDAADRAWSDAGRLVSSRPTYETTSMTARRRRHGREVGHPRHAGGRGGRGRSGRRSWPTSCGSWWQADFDRHRSSFKTDPASAALLNATTRPRARLRRLLLRDERTPERDPAAPRSWPWPRHANLSGRDLIRAYAVGFEVAIMLTHTVNPDHYRHGWHGTGTRRRHRRGAAAAQPGGPARRADAQRALGRGRRRRPGCARTSAPTSSPTTPATPHVPASWRPSSRRAAMSVTTRSWRASGASSTSSRPGRDVIAAAGGRVRAPLEHPAARVSPPRCSRPAGRRTPRIGGVLELRERGLRAADVEHVDVALTDISHGNLQYPDPSSGLEAKFSLQYCVARALTAGVLGLDDFTDEAATRSAACAP